MIVVVGIVEESLAKRDEALLKQHIEKFLASLPISEHIKEWKIIYHSALTPVKSGVVPPWDIYLHTHYNDSSGKPINVVLGVKTK